MLRRRKKRPVAAEKPVPVGYSLNYPEIFYRVMPDVMAACDEVDKHKIAMPTREMVEQVSQRIHDSVCAKYPDLAEYAHEYERRLPRTTNETVKMFDIEIKQSGLFLDLIAFLFLAEFFRRHRRVRRLGIVSLSQ